MGLNEALVGKSYPETTFEVTQKQIEEYARATNDDNRGYVGSNALASPVFVVVPAFSSFMAAATDPDLGADMLRLVHGSEEHVLHKPVRVGDVLTVSPVLESVYNKDTGETFTVLATETDAGGDLVAEVRGTMFIRGTGDRRRAAAAVAGGGEAPGETVYEETTKVDADQTFRYAKASGDNNPIHLDPDTARAAGLPGIILHGMCTMAFATKAAVNGLAGGDPSRIARVAVQFSRTVLPGQELTTKLWHRREGEYGFETYNPAGKPVIRGGKVEIAAP
jgi:acyl dehydratase